MTAARQLSVDLQNQPYNKATAIYPNVPLEEALESIMYESSSEDAYLTFCEGFLDQENDALLQDIRKQVTGARECLFPNDADWFANYFPPDLRPSDALVIAGAGATSTLHRDPFEWMGTSLCMEGSKVWRFIDPNSNVHAVDEALQSYRLESIAWQGVKSAGWQSDLSLYRKRQHEMIPTAFQWFKMEDEGEERKLTELMKVGSSTDILSPDEIDADLSISTAIQQTGDLLLIPAHWWHQTYALEPSIAIASQRVGRHDSALVLQHILDHNHQASTDAKAILAASENSPEAALAELLSVIS
jgi:hypothetical protein